jgi:hypothetical protein
MAARVGLWRAETLRMTAGFLSAEVQNESIGCPVVYKLPPFRKLLGHHGPDNAGLSY